MMKNILKSFFKYNPDSSKEFILNEKGSTPVREKDNMGSSFGISKVLKDNLENIKYIYSYPKNSDVVIRKFSIGKNKDRAAFLIYIDGMCDKELVNEFIIKPFMNIPDASKNIDINKLRSDYLVQAQSKVADSMKKVIEAVNFGEVALFIDGDNEVICSDVKKYEHRSVEKPTSESIVMGPQDSFNESLRSNTALIRQRLQDEDLVIESFRVGQRSQTPCAFLYIKNITNMDLVNEVKRRVESIDVDMINDSGELEQFIEDNTFNPVPQVIKTERPDLTASKLAEGKVAIIVNGSPIALLLPAEVTEFLQTIEDRYIRFPYVELMKIIRIICIFLSLVFPGIYVAVLTYHQAMIPSNLLYAIEASREQVPFSAVTELLIMQFIFDIISEASIRTPKPVGATFGIVGALVMGQAAVAANVVSPILIIVVAVCGLGTFVIPNYSFSFSVRVMKYFFVLAAAISGMLGVTLMIFLSIILLLASKSFGIPLMMSSNSDKSESVLYRKPIWKQQMRPDSLSTQDNVKQPMYSRKWWEYDKKGKGGGSNE